MTEIARSGNIASMKRVPVTEDQHRKAKAKAAEMGLTLERFVDGVLEDAVAKPAEELVGVMTGACRHERERRNGKQAVKAS